MTTIENDLPRCPICPRSRRNERPLCNRHMQRAGGPLVKRWFARAAHHRHLCMTGSAAVINASGDRLRDIEARMTSNAQRYEEIRATGRHPVWSPTRDTWDDPRDRAREVLVGWHNRHHFGDDPANDRNVIDRIVDDLFPPDEGKAS